MVHVSLCACTHASTGLNLYHILTPFPSSGSISSPFLMWSVYPLHCYHTDTHTITNNHEMGGCVTYVGNGGGCLCRGIGLWELEGLRSRTDSGWRFEVGLRPIQAFELRVPVINSSPMSIFKGSAEQDTHALYQKSCHTLLRGLMSRSKKLLRLNRGCQPTDLWLYVGGYTCLHITCNCQELCHQQIFFSNADINTHKRWCLRRYLSALGHEVH